MGVLKKVYTILLLILLAFNWFGYRLVVSFFEAKNDLVLEKSFDAETYDPTSLIEIKIPLQVAYQINSNTYERCNGEVKHEGKFYKYVKRKIANDTLYLMCINNTHKAALETAKTDFFKINNDINHKDGKKENSKHSIGKNLLGDFDNQFYNYKNLSDLLGISRLYNLFPNIIYSFPYSKFSAQPPDLFYNV